MPIKQQGHITDAKRLLWNKVLEIAWIISRQRVCECVDEAKDLGLIGLPYAIECLFCCADMLEDMLRAKRRETNPYLEYDFQHNF